MKILVTGVKGQLGHDVQNELEKRGHTCVGVDIDTMDITDAKAVRERICKDVVDGVIHCAAYTQVDQAEENVEICRKVNYEGTKNIACACQEANVKMIYISTDYVFDGEGTRPWEPEDSRHPLNVYGQTKCEGEEIVEKLLDKYYIVRIAWVFGKNGRNFVKTMLELGHKHSHLTVVNDQIGSPTYTYDLAKLLVDMIETEKYGKYHATNEGFCSWYEFAVEIFRQAGLSVEVEPVASDAYPTKAKRPHNSRMNKQKLVENGFSLLPTWQDALARYLKQLEEE